MRMTAGLGRFAQLISRRTILVAFWAGALIALGAMAYDGPLGWDAKVCWTAIDSARHGGDPYADGVTALQGYRQQIAQSAGHVAGHAVSRPKIPLIFVYPPLVLHLLQWLAGIPPLLLAVAYGAMIAAGIALQLWAGYQLATEGERRWLSFLLPLVLFFPGLLVDDAILSGNIAYVVYGAVLAAGVAGVKRGEWKWFYAAVLVASLFKAPFLYLLAFPVLVGSGQWMPAAGTGAAGIAAFAVQRWIWPQQFAEYLQCLSLMFSEAHDFGFGPAGVLSRYTAEHGRANASALTMGHLGFAAVLGIAMLAFSRLTWRAWLTTGTWATVALFGTFLFNPRIMVYDMFPVTIPMALIAWRTIARLCTDSLESSEADGDGSFHPLPLIGAGMMFGVANLLAALGPQWGIVELSVLMVLLGGGLWLAWTESQVPQALAEVEASVESIA